jgi:hypothetical protein
MYASINVFGVSSAYRVASLFQTPFSAASSRLQEDANGDSIGREDEHRARGRAIIAGGICLNGSVSLCTHTKSSKSSTQGLQCTKISS